MFKNWFKKKQKQVEEEQTEQQNDVMLDDQARDSQLDETTDEFSEEVISAESDRDIDQQVVAQVEDVAEVVEGEQADLQNEAENSEALDNQTAEADLAQTADDKTTLEADNIEEQPAEKQGFFKKLFQGLGKTRQNITENIDRMLNNYDEIDEDLFEELEEILITADVGMNTALKLVEDLKERLVERRIADPQLVKEALQDVLAESLTSDQSIELVPQSPTVILVIGVNGAGKTTSIGKIGHLLKSEGKKVVLAAADTFRAAAIDQLKVWGERADIPVIAHSEGADPAAVVFDACQSAKSKGVDTLIVDTAGRLHNKVNLMNELSKIFRIIDREFSDAHKEVLLVLDATTGQNALQQAKLFKEAAPISGLVITKLDGTAKGGFVFSIKNELDIPVKLICVGEKINDLQHFDAAQFAKALMK